MNRTESMALVVVACILVLILGAGGVMLKFQESRADTREGAAMFDDAGEAVAQESVFMKRGSIWPQFFREPFETAVFVFRDGSFLTYTTQQTGVHVQVSSIVEDIQHSGRSIREIVFCVHNHFTPMWFTETDKDTYHYLRRKGFVGVFGIYYTASGRFREMEEK